MSKLYAQRIKILQQRIADWKVDALLITNPVDIRYLTGFVGDDSWAVVRLRSSMVHVLSDFRFQQQIKREAPKVRAIMRKASLSDEVKKMRLRYKIKKIAIQQDHVTLAQHKALAKAVGGSGVSRLKPVDDGLVMQRAVKTPNEVKLIEKALRIQEKAYRATLNFIAPGKTENQIAAYLEYQMRELGAEGSSFPTIAAVDANAALPHAVPSAKKVKKGGIVLVDWGAKFNGYCSDLTRVVGVGSMTKRMQGIYAIVLEAQCAAIDAIAPGRKLADIDKIARDIISDAGYGKQFGHSLGHGIGLDIHEQPVLASRAKGKLQAGHVVTVEPGIYLPGVGGVRIEDDVLVTPRGGRVLSKLPKSLESAMI
jgi:Xaa-Pro aminopeptidase